MMTQVRCLILGRVVPPVQLLSGAEDAIVR